MPNYTDFYSELKEDFPIGWSKDEFDKMSSFSGKLKYANERLRKMASGSGRVVYDIDGKQVIKIAKNKKGLAQNGVEGEPYLQNYDIVAKVFDRGDEVQDIGPFFVVMELAKKVTRRRFEALTGVGLDDLDWYLREMRSRFSSMPATMKEKLNNNEFIMDLTSLTGDYDMSTGDMGRLSTYGEVVREGQPKIVLVDFGLTSGVWNDFYKVN